MKIGYVSAFVFSQLYRQFPLVVTPSDRRAAEQTFTSWLHRQIITNPVLRFA